MGVLIAALVVTLAMFVPIGISAVYDKDGGCIWLQTGPIKKLLFPVKKDLERKKKVKKNKSEEDAGKSVAADRKGGSVSDFYPFITLVFDFLSDFRRKLRVDIFRLHIVLAGGDPADLAQNYGKAWAAVGALWPNLERIFTIINRDVSVQCDFEGKRTFVNARLDITLTVGRLLSMGIRHGFKFIKEYFQFRKKRNGGTI